MASVIMLIFTNKCVFEMNVNEEGLKLPTVNYFYIKPHLQNTRPMRESDKIKTSNILKQ